MKLAKFELFEYELPLAQPIVTRGQELSRRSGLLVKLSSDSGSVGWGEIAPLPGFSRESLEFARQETLKLKSPLIGTDLPEDLSPRGKGWSRWKLPGDLAPSVRCGLELAVWNLHPVEEPRRKVLVNGLLTGPRDEVFHWAYEMVRLGYRAVKLKVGGRPLAEEIEITWKVRDTAGDRVRLRLDANRAWSLDQAVKFGKAVSTCDIDYIEEPTADPADFEAFSSECGIPVALDETLLHSPIKALEEIHGIKAIILKPTLLGGFQKAHDLAQKAQSLRIQPVVSSCFESGVGILGLARFAAFLSLEYVAAGLDTYRWLQADVLVPKLEIDRGSIEVSLPVERGREIKMDSLREIGDG
ncbi:MAG TPA: o-succinylbenzoate synthase [Candidatus Binatia bacterium]|jgi:O-succinylbenzoate synthase|nr:o-succinylbenzoate synthase [Candidatus Binatia bacterium]